jgi:hypothetical protein
MIGFLGVLFLLAAIGGFGSYWISWEMQDFRSRPTFRAKLMNDLARVFRAKRAAIATMRMPSQVADGESTPVGDSVT